ncbi:MAG: NUDIX domain-containing protein [Sulfurimonas sp.]|nr:NUDIX domain-containing protein [Sulfurimonas sp.]
MSSIDKVGKLTNPKFIKPIKINYTHKGQKKIWEAVINHDSVSILLYHKEKDAFVIVKQLRIPVLYMNKTNGEMHELCAGLVDKDKPIKQIAKEEVFEECGYDVALKNIQKVSSFYTNVGTSGALQTLFYAQIDSTMKINDGGGLIEEDIEVIYIPLQDARKFMFDESYQKTPGLIMGFYWFFDTHPELFAPSS